MLRSLFLQFEEWGIRLRNKAQTDPFFLARIQVMVLYFAAGALIFMFLGWYISSVRFAPVIELASFGPPGSAAQIAYEQYQHEKLIRRLLLVAIFLASTYFITEFALRSVRKSVALQQRFFGTVSHELRTPLTIMKNNAEVALRAPELSEPKARAVIGSMLEETDRLSKTLNFLLALTSLSMEKVVSDLETVQFEDVVRKAVHGVQHDIDTKTLALTVSCSGNSTIRGNAAALYGLVTNLVINAIRHTDSGGTITVAVDTTSKFVTLRVVDTGAGIDVRDLPYIFEPFFQGKATGLGADGLGLGLSFVREVTRLHNARIHVESEVGHGTSFTIHFRRA